VNILDPDPVHFNFSMGPHGSLRFSVLSEVCTVPKHILQRGKCRKRVGLISRLEFLFSKLHMGHTLEIPEKHITHRIHLYYLLPVKLLTTSLALN